MKLNKDNKTSKWKRHNLNDVFFKKYQDRYEKKFLLTLEDIINQEETDTKS